MRTDSIRMMVWACVLLTACGPGGSDTSRSPVGPNQRIGWDQRAASQAELATYAFTLYVDDQPSSLKDVQCSELSDEQVAQCSAQLPPLSAGSHTLSLSTRDADGRESARSESLDVDAGGSASLTATAQRSNRTGEPPTATASGDADLQWIPGSVTQPTDLAATADGRVFIAERSGRIRIMAGDAVPPWAAVELDDVTTDGGGGLLSMTLDPQFAKNGWVYALYTSSSGFRVSRFREAAGTLAERVIILDGIAASNPATGVVRFGPDAKLYAALDDGGLFDVGNDLGSFNGKVLRLNADGTTPADQASFTPVFVPNVAVPRALDWSPARGTLWIAEGGANQPGLLSVVAEDRPPKRRGRIDMRYAIPDGLVPSAAVFYRGGSDRGWADSLLVALPDTSQMLRLTVDPTLNVVSKVALAIDGEAGRIRALAVDAGGMVYLANDERLGVVLPRETSPDRQPIRAR
jgi:glucose/arabinose dehydrogenase